MVDACSPAGRHDGPAGTGPRARRGREHRRWSQVWTLLLRMRSSLGCSGRGRPLSLHVHCANRSHQRVLGDARRIWFPRASRVLGSEACNCLGALLLVLGPVGAAVHRAIRRVRTRRRCRPRRDLEVSGWLERATRLGMREISRAAARSGHKARLVARTAGSCGSHPTATSSSISAGPRRDTGWARTRSCWTPKRRSSGSGGRSPRRT